jgi:isochorismate hydrolase
MAPVLPQCNCRGLIQSLHQSRTRRCPTSGVVLSTVRHAGDLDYRLVVVRDCCADPDAEVHAMLLDIVIAKQAAVVTTAELAGALSGRSS